MPSRRVASITSVPAGTSTSRSSILSFTSFVSAIGSLPQADHRFGSFVVSAASLQVIFEFVAEFLHDADGGHRGGVAERAEGAAEHVLGELADQVDVFRAAEAGVEALQHSIEPVRAFAAGDAPAAGFVRVEVHDAARHIHHAGVFVDDDHAARAEHGTGLGDGVVVHGDINFVGFEDRAGASARDDGLQFLPAAHAAGHFIDELLHVHAERNLIDAGLVHVAGDAEKAGTA